MIYIYVYVHKKYRYKLILQVYKNHQMNKDIIFNNCKENCKEISRCRVPLLRRFSGSALSEKHHKRSFWKKIFLIFQTAFQMCFGCFCALAIYPDLSRLRVQTFAKTTTLRSEKNRGERQGIFFFFHARSTIWPLTSNFWFLVSLFFFLSWLIPDSNRCQM